MYKGEAEILTSLKTGRKTIEQLAAHLNLSADGIRRAVESLKAAGAVSLEIEEKSDLKPSAEFVAYARAKEMPEFRVFVKAENGASVADLENVEKTIGLRWAKVKGWIAIENGKLVPKTVHHQVVSDNAKLIESCHGFGGIDAKMTEELINRGLLQKQVKRTVYVTATGKPPAQDTSFNIQAAARDAPLGRKHPLTKMADRIRQIFAEMGFEEMDGSAIETAFWNFDALFQPQDHPARELADTFYIDGNGELPADRKLVERVKKSHEHGWKTRWDENEAKKRVLRTHTTALSARYLAAMDKTPKKYFAVGRVFRNEATDYKHLAEFHQVEGIIAWENATFRDLLGILKEFYGKLGFNQIRFRPSYFPYTEPSLEVEVYFEPRKQWMELGGAGIFRPEVSKPLCNTYPVLAWGLSLERPLMMLMELEDIRTFYKNDFDWLKNARL